MAPLDAAGQAEVADVLLQGRQGLLQAGVEAGALAEVVPHLVPQPHPPPHPRGSALRPHPPPHHTRHGDCAAVLSGEAPPRAAGGEAAGRGRSRQPGAPPGSCTALVEAEGGAESGLPCCRSAPAAALPLHVTCPQAAPASVPPAGQCRVPGSLRRRGSHLPALRGPSQKLR